MKPGDIRKILVIAGLFAGLVWCISALQTGMNRIRSAEKLTDVSPIRDAPPIVAFTTIALGGFRGLIADILFLRLQSSQEDENYFELVQLASWIVKLQPGFTSATSYLAWNMAYNVSVMFSAPEDRWRWVKNGLELLRDEALVYNPGDPSLYRQLGWMYQHKIGQIFDDAHKYYKSQLALEIIYILGDQDRFDWKTLANSPRTEEEFLRSLGKRGKAFFDLLAKKNTNLEKVERDFRRLNKFSESLESALNETGLLLSLQNYFRRRWLKEELKLDADVVYELIRKYGYLDFRLPQAHAIYWAYLGLKHAPGNEDLDCERMIFNSLKSAFTAGKLTYFADTSSFHTSPNIALADAVRTAYLEALAKYDNDTSVLAGYENFMVNAIVVLYTFNQRGKARSFLKNMRESDRFRDNPRYGRNLDAFVLQELAGDLSSMSPQQAQQIIQALFFQSYEALILGDLERATGFELMARKIYASYMNKLVGRPERERRGLAEFKMIKSETLSEFSEILRPNLQKRLSAGLKGLTKGELNQ